MAAKKSAKKSAKSTPKKASAKPAASTKASTLAFDQHTRAGREAIDKAVSAKLTKSFASRGEVATALGIDPIIASASLKRLAAAGVAQTAGHHGATRYAKA